MLHVNGFRASGIMCGAKITQFISEQMISIIPKEKMHDVM